MAKEVINPILGQRLRQARKALSLSQEALAERVGAMGQSAIAEIEGGRVDRPKRLMEIARHLDVSEDWLLGLSDQMARNAAADEARVRAEPNASAPEYREFDTSEKIPVYGEAVAGDDGRFIMNGQKIADVFCPPPLVGIKGAYAVYVHGDSMEDRYYAGETVWLHPYLPVRRNEFVVAQIRSDAEGEPPLSFVKQFVSRSKREGLVLRQLNPPQGADELLRFPDELVFSVHKIVFSGQS
jgi:phage repressor protein C with HTH and peptisase S24 domain